MARIDGPLRVVSGLAGLPGRVRLRSEVAPPQAYAVVDVETTGTRIDADEIVALAVVRLDAHGRELDRFASLVRPVGPIPPESTAVHGLDDAAVAAAPTFAELAPELLPLLDDAVFVAHNAEFDLPLVEHAFARAGLRYRHAGVACTLDAFRLLEPTAPSHRLEPLSRRHGIELDDAHDARGDVLATVGLLRILLDEGIAPETVELDESAYQRLRSRGDTRPASAAQIRRLLALAGRAGLVREDGTTDAAAVARLVARLTGRAALGELTREQVQDVFDALERRAAAHGAGEPAAERVA
jgi:DNA polymerase III epsilon subunit family exonuclease